MNSSPAPSSRIPPPSPAPRCAVRPVPRASGWAINRAGDSTFSPAPGLLALAVALTLCRAPRDAALVPAPAAAPSCRAETFGRGRQARHISARPCCSPRVLLPLLPSAIANSYSTWRR